jgi:hypothetical protein
MKRILSLVLPVPPAFYAGVCTGLALCGLAIAFMS